MSGAWGAIGVLALGAAGWFATAFFARPLMRFVDLRGEVIYRMVLYDNAAARWKERPDGTVEEVEGISEEEIKRLEEAQGVFRDLAARMRAFALNDHFAAWIVKWRYDPLRASAALIGVSNTLHKYGGNRAHQKKAVEEALRFRV